MIPPSEVSSLLQESAAPLEPPSEYVAIWVKVPSAEERIARAKEQHAEQVLHEETLKEETSGKDTDDKVSDTKLGVVEGLGKLSLAKVEVRARKLMGRSSSEGEKEEAKPKKERKKSISKKVEEVTVTQVSPAMKTIGAAEVTMEKSPSPVVKTPEKIVKNGHDQEVD